jgi:hypothetical protein
MSGYDPLLKRIIVVLAVAALGLVACSSPEPLEGIDLPPASVADEIQPEAWAVTFTHDFPAGAWPEGTHFYELALACDPILDEPTRTASQAFDVVSPSPTFDQPIYLRIVGLSHFLMGPQTLFAIDPQQPTTAALTIIGVSEADALAANESCAGAVFYDGEDPLPLFPHPPFRP